MKRIRLKKLWKLKIHLLFLLGLMMLSINAVAQVKVDETCETKLAQKESELKNAISKLKKLTTQFDDTLELLQQTTVALQDAQQRITTLSSAVQGMDDNNSKYKELEEKIATTEREKQKAEDDLQVTKIDLGKTKDDLANVQTTNSKLTGTISEIQHTFPFIVTGVNFKNTNKKGRIINDYNANLLKIEWLTVQISYKSLLDEPKNIELEIKIYMPKNNQLWINPKITSDYTVKTKAYLTTGEGNVIINEWEKGKSNFPPGELKRGRYRMEIWYNDVCLRQNIFTVY